MARTKAAAEPAELIEQEFQSDVVDGLANTESEIFADATQGEPRDTGARAARAPTGEAPEGDGLDDEAAASTMDGEVGATDTTPPRADDRDSGDNKDRSAVGQSNALYHQLAALEARFNDLDARLGGQGRQPGPPDGQQTGSEKPDMFANPELYEQWLLGRATRDALIQLQAHQHADYAQRVDHNLAQASRGDRGFEFAAAYRALVSLDANKRDHQALVHRIYNAPDPSSALLEWWDQNDGPQFREQILAQLSASGRRTGARNEPRGEPRLEFRHEIRPGQTLPSLNGAAGSNSRGIGNPEFLDNSDASVFDFATRR